MKISQKIGSLLRRSVAFFCLTYDWEEKELKIIENMEEYLSQITKLRDLGMCKRCECILPKGITICDLAFQVTLISYGDIRANRCVYGENPIGKEFGVCLFDYVFLFLSQKQDQSVKVYNEKKDVTVKELLKKQLENQKQDE